MKPNIKVTPISKKKDPPAPQPVQIQQPQTIRLATTTQDASKQIKKPKYNIVLTSSPAQPKTQIIPMQTTNQQNTPKTVSIQDVKFLPSNKCYVPITIKDCNSDQQIVAQIDTKNLVLPTTYHLQMKVTDESLNSFQKIYINKNSNSNITAATNYHRWRPTNCSIDSSRPTRIYLSCTSTVSTTTSAAASNTKLPATTGPNDNACAE